MQTIVLITINVDKYKKSENASKMTSKKSKQHNVFEAEEQILRTELVKFICPTTREWETTYTRTSLEKDVMHQLMIATANSQLGKCVVFKNDHKIVNQLVRYAF